MASEQLANGVGGKISVLVISTWPDKSVNTDGRDFAASAIYRPQNAYDIRAMEQSENDWLSGWLSFFDQIVTKTK